MGARNPLQRSVLHVQADGESCSFCVYEREREKKFDGENSSFVHTRHKNIMLVWERYVPVRASVSMNNALAVGVFIYNTMKMLACELRRMLKAS